MNAFLSPHNNGPSLTGKVDVTAHSISLFQKDEPPKNINDIPILKVILVLLSLMMFRSLNWRIILSLCTNPLEILMAQKVGGSESLLNYMNENFFSKDDPAINEHHYHITKKQYNEEANNIYNIDNSKTFNIKNKIFLNEQYFHKKTKHK